MQKTSLLENYIPKGFTVNNLRCKPEAAMMNEIEPHREFSISYMNWSTLSRVGECTFILSSGSHMVTGGYSQMTPDGVKQQTISKTTMKIILFVISISITVLLVGCLHPQSESTKEQKTEPVFQKGDKITNSNFTGSAWLKMLVNSDSTFNTSIGNVTFEPKARTNWHKHPGGQILLVTDGKGYNQEKGKPVQLLNKGDVVKIPPDAEHWHGAAPDNGLTHIAISLNTNKGGAVWSGPVTDKEYDNVEK